MLRKDLWEDRRFSDPRKLPPVPYLPCGFYPDAISLEEIKVWNKRGLFSEGSNITVVVSSITDNLDKVFSGPTATQQGVTESVAEMQ